MQAAGALLLLVFEKYKKEMSWSVRLLVACSVKVSVSVILSDGLNVHGRAVSKFVF